MAQQDLSHAALISQWMASLAGQVNWSACIGGVFQAAHPGKAAQPPSPADTPVHQADVIEVDAIKHKQANVGILESSFLKHNEQNSAGTANSLSKS